MNEREAIDHDAIKLSSGSDARVVVWQDEATPDTEMKAVHVDTDH